MMSKYKILFTNHQNRSKILITILCIFIYRFGCNLPVPFVDLKVLSNLSNNNMLSYLSLMSGGSLENASFFALGVMPFINASIILQLLTSVIPKLEQLKGAGKKGEDTINRILKIMGFGFSLLLAVLYYFMVKGMNALKYTTGKEALFSAIVIIAIYVAGATIVYWLSSQIDAYGIGNGMSMIIFIGILNGLKGTILKTHQTSTQMLDFIILYVFLFVSLFFIVYVCNSKYEIHLQYNKKEKVNYAAASDKIPVKIMMAGVMPVIFAGSLTSIPNAFIGLVQNTNSVMYKILSSCTYSNPIYCIIYIVLILLFNKFYVKMQFNSAEMAETLRKNNGIIQGIRPGKETEVYIDNILNKINILGGIILASITIVPILIQVFLHIDFQFGGTSILILVQVGLEIINTLKEMTKSKTVSRFI